MQPVKPGNKTSEFWAKLFVQAVMAINAVLPAGQQIAEVDDTVAMAIIGGLEALYMVLRTWAKRSPSPRS
jgi:hypothetical protein